MNKRFILLWCIALTWLLPGMVQAQKVTLNHAIRIAQENSLDAQLARFSFQASYWNYRSFKAEFLPSLNLNGNLANYNRSLVETRNYDDGRLAYVSNNTLNNSLTLSLDQEIAATGGRISLMSYLHRLDQFTYKDHTFNTQPLRISYTQLAAARELHSHPAIGQKQIIHIFQKTYPYHKAALVV